MRRLLFGFVAALLLAACSLSVNGDDASMDADADAAADRAAIETVLARVNRAFEVGDADAFASGFAEDAVFETSSETPPYGYQRTRYEGRAQVREVVSDRVERMAAADPKTLSYDPASLRRYNRNSDELIELVDAMHARHSSTWMVVMKTNVDIHTSAIGRYEDELEKRDGAWLITRRQRIE